MLLQLNDRLGAAKAGPPMRLVMLQILLQVSLGQGPSCSLSGCSRALSAPSVLYLSSIPHFIFSLPSLHRPQPSPEGPLQLPSTSAAQTLNVPCNSHTLCSSVQCLDRAPLSPRSLCETHRRDCLSLMSPSPHHLGKEGKIHKEGGKCINAFRFSFCSTLLKRPGVLVLGFSQIFKLSNQRTLLIRHSRSPSTTRLNLGL